jgi:selenocysteine-specific elongation factor
VRSGTAQVGDVLHLLPAETEVRIRRLQSHGVDVEQIAAGERAAINLAGVKATAIDRGNELATPGVFEPARRHLVQLRTLPGSTSDLKHRDLVRLHLGADQATVQVLMEQRAVPPGGTAFAVLRTSRNIVTEYGEPFVLRQLSPARTIGGGTVIGPALRPTERLNRCLQAAEGLASRDPEIRLAAYVDLHREVDPDRELKSQLGLSQSEYRSACQNLLERKEIVRAGSEKTRLVTTNRFTQLKQLMLAQCQAEVERRRPADRRARPRPLR